MRLTCPNCDAQYEVPDNVVPLEGRDVQCSNCGQTWFQHHADHVPPVETDSQDHDQGDEETQAPEPDQPEETPEPRQENKGLDDLDDLPDAPAARTMPPRKELDPAVADILRQEAETEQAARAEQVSESLESQPDLGLSESDPSPDERTLQARQRMARLRGEPEPMSEADVNAAAVSSRRDLLPDIDEINSTLRTENERGTASEHPEIAAPTTQRRRRGFRTGFLLILILFAILAAVYIYAPQIAQAVPQADPYLSSYVAWVDQMRLWLDGHVQNLLRWLDTMASRSAT